MLRRHRCHPTAVLVAAFSALVLLAPSARAEIPQCGTASNYHEDYSSASNAPTSYEGTSATIVVRKGSVCDTVTNNSNTSSAWTMISPSNRTGWAQSGYIRWYGSSIYHFAQYRKNGSTAYVTKIGSTALATGASYQYWQQSLYNSTAGQWQVRQNVNTTVLLQTNFDTFSSWTQPYLVSWSGETNYTASDVPGTSSAPARFSSMQVQLYSDDSWTSTLPALGVGSQSSRYHVSAVSGNAFNMWTA